MGKGVYRVSYEIKPGISVKSWFLTYADEFYILTRFSYYSFLQDMAFLNSHHTIEYYLKAGLAEKLSLQELKSMGHNLIKLWNRNKKYYNLDKSFEKHIFYYNRFEELRYPRSDSFTKILWGMSLNEFFRRFETAELQKRVACFFIDDFDELISNIRKKICSSQPIMNVSKEQKFYIYKDNTFFKR